MIKLDDCAILHYRLGKEYAQSLSKKFAREEFKKAYELDSYNADICQCYALSLFEEKQYSQAYTIINQAIELAKEKQVLQDNILLYIYYTKAMILQKQKKNEEALKAYLLAQQYKDEPNFDVHQFKFVTLINENAVYEYLHQKRDYTAAQSDKEYHTLKAMTVGNVYSIGHSIYKNIASSLVKKYKINPLKARAASGNLFSTVLASKDFSLTAKMSFSKSYVFGNYSFYIKQAFFCLDILCIPQAPGNIPRRPCIFSNNQVQ